MMTKEEVLSILKTHPNGNIEESNFKKKFPEHYQILSTWNFPTDFKFTQKLFHYFNNDPELKLGLCPVCGNRCKFVSFGIGYLHHCSIQCSRLDNNVQMKMKEASIKKWGYEYPSQSPKFRAKVIQTCNEKYGCDNISQVNEIIEKKKQTKLDRYGDTGYHNIEKMKQTNLQRYGCESVFSNESVKNKIQETIRKIYGVDNPFQSEIIKDKIKQTNIRLYNCEHNMQSEEIREKAYKTKKKNKTFNTSCAEIELTKWFKDNNIDILTQYKCDRYPYMCDFYLPKYDLFIEIQGSWTHGGHPFDKNNNNDIKILHKWISKNTEYYNRAIEVWTKRDVEKRQIAQKNNLNFVEIFSKYPDVVIKEVSKILKKQKENV